MKCFRIAICVLVLALSCWAGNRAKPDTLSEFYVAVDAVSDASPFWFKYVLHVEPIADGSRVRYIRVAPGEHPCTETVTVKAAGAVLKGTPVRDLPGMNLCQLTERDVEMMIAPFRPKGIASIWDTAAFGIVVKCGSEEKLFKLPYADEVDYDRLTKNAPKIKKLYDLVYKIVRQAFGKSPLHNLSPIQDIAVQEMGASYLEELRSGRFDRGFWKRQFSMRDALESYRGTYAPAPLEGRIVDEGVFQFVTYVPAKYPQMAKMARVEGKVSLRIDISEKTGAIEKVDVISGHPMLQQNAIDAVRQWVLKPTEHETSPVVTLDFAFHCPKP